MGLLKGANLRFNASEAIVGADVILPADLPGEEVTGVVPATESALDALPGEGVDELAFDLEGDLTDLFAEPDIATELEDELSEPWQEPLEAFEKIREQVLHGAVEASDLDANAFGDQVQQAAGPLMADAVRAAEEDMLERNPEADTASVTPFVQRRVATELDLELIGSVNEIRWTHLQRVEKQLSEGAADIAQGLLAEHPEEAFVELMAHREEILSAARLESERLLLEAMTQSAETMAQAEQARAATLQELESDRARIMADLREQAYAEGLAEGRRAGEAEAAQYIADAIHKFNEMVMAFPLAVKQNEEKLVSLALEIARKVIQEEVSLQPEIVQRTVESSLKRVSDLEQVVVKVNPLDLDLILPKQETFKTMVPDVQNFSIEGSHTIQRGGCIIETNSGSINATIQAQLGIVEELFKRVRAEYDDEVLGDLS
ncbi:MAG: FliH/SctL family protein [Candidatus Sericytochromatia bacterium]|nr:FliH/SctL family protein [Candidatus Sericytochromatia bacterium]